MSTIISVFDPAMCCSTGVCGPTSDPELARFAADVEWLKAQGATVKRYNLSSEPAAFAENVLVKDALGRGTEVLPIVMVDGRIATEGSYPSRETLAALAGVVAGKAAKPAGGGCCSPKVAADGTAPKAGSGGCC
jgi:hypothetical protein